MTKVTASILSVLSVAIVIVCMSVGCAAHKHAESGTTSYALHAYSGGRKSVEGAKRLIDLCPCPGWTTFSKTNMVTKEKIMQHLQRLSSYNPGTIREAMRLYVDERHAQLKYNSDDATKLFLINRYICNVPEWVEGRIEPRLPGWIGIPEKNGFVNMLWPLGFDAQGKLTLVGGKLAYFGADPAAVEEFDYFLMEYGLRFPP